MRSSRTLALWAAVLLTLTACGGQRSFVREELVEIVSPAPHTWHRQPIELRWTVTDPELRERVANGEVAFGVFVDRRPIGPDGSLFDLGDEDCERREDCPNAEWLADRQVYVTRESSLLLSELRDNRTSDAADARDPHEAVIVLLDDAGTRLGESYGAVRFAVDRTR